ncbi:hypothetical protein [Rhizobium laguerreae]|uniref:hypothetical protein n=1 Tax=Rhizobium laguerreae TaxID=1076926 RepID=UPI001C913AB9|nr:hypothetical protein [Rhizobium laguerreae]MBY3314720.1 hypothetical protein [Rhizobium laguerreae]
MSKKYAPSATEVVVVVSIDDILSAVDVQARANPPKKASIVSKEAFLRDPKVSEKVWSLRDDGFTAEEIADLFTKSGRKITAGNLSQYLPISSRTTAETIVEEAA